MSFAVLHQVLHYSIANKLSSQQESVLGLLQLAFTMTAFLLSTCTGLLHQRVLFLDNNMSVRLHLS